LSNSDRESRVTATVSSRTSKPSLVGSDPRRNDLIWRDDRWLVDPNAVEETGFMNLVNAARRESGRAPEGHTTAQLLQRVTQTYRILFTRALKGVYVWVPDPETRARLTGAIE
jgi:DUF2075 family protein